MLGLIVSLGLAFGLPAANRAMNGDTPVATTEPDHPDQHSPEVESRSSRSARTD
jgi:hypothetical protein